MKLTISAALAASALAEIGRALAESVDLDRIIALRHQAIDLLHRIRASALGRDLLNLAAELKLRAERKAGNILRDLHLPGGDRKSDQAKKGI